MLQAVTSFRWADSAALTGMFPAQPATLSGLSTSGPHGRVHSHERDRTNRRGLGLVGVGGLHCTAVHTRGAPRWTPLMMKNMQTTSVLVDCAAGPAAAGDQGRVPSVRSTIAT